MCPTYLLLNATGSPVVSPCHRRSRVASSSLLALRGFWTKGYIGRRVIQLELHVGLRKVGRGNRALPKRMKRDICSA